ncbi:hypothetical protein VZT92_004545 [Zoarces viviparus]|uniref:Uncharacterized protein n=1 Tax=Zoarces viviparus TaxID=48416 RepID=A0AAW1FX19_ZOAVI
MDINPTWIQSWSGQHRGRGSFSCACHHIRHFFGPLNAVSQSFLVSKKEFSKVLRDFYQRVKNRRVVVAGFRRCGLYLLDPMAIDWSRVMPSGPRRGASSPPPPTPPASSWAVPDVALSS